MSIVKYTKILHKLKLQDGDVFDLYVVTSYDFGSNYSIIKIESATGDGGVTYNNGRMVEEIPINGTLLGNSIEDITEKILKLRKIADRKEVVDFVYPYKSDIRTNKFYIESVRFTPISGKDTEIDFSIILVEKRDANVKTTQVNLVNYAHSESLKAIAEQRLIGGGF